MANSAIHAKEANWWKAWLISQHSAFFICQSFRFECMFYGDTRMMYLHQMSYEQLDNLDRQIHRCEMESDGEWWVHVARLDWQLASVLMWNIEKASCHLQVIVPAPYWTSYPSMATLTGAKPVIVQTKMEDGYLLTVSDLERNLTERSRVLILCTPSNPTGAVYPKATLQVWNFKYH